MGGVDEVVVGGGGGTYFRRMVMGVSSPLRALMTPLGSRVTAVTTVYIATDSVSQWPITLHSGRRDEQLS